MNMPDDAMFTSPRGLREWYSFLKAHPDEIPLCILMAVLTVPEFFIGLTSEGKRTFFDTRRFPWVARLEQNWPRIRHELDALLFKVDEIPNFQEVQIEQRLLTTDDKWKTYFFYVYDSRVERNCRECPMTARLIRTIPGMKTRCAPCSARTRRCLRIAGLTKAYCAITRARQGPLTGLQDRRCSREFATRMV